MKASPLNFLVVVLTSLYVLSSHAAIRTLSPDLAFNLKCPRSDEPSLEQMIEDFLNSNEFRVVNQAKIEREYGRRSFTMRIVGVDSNKRIIEFIGFPATPERFTVSLFSRPPTVHAHELEALLQHFSSEKLGCQIAQLRHGSNDADSLDLFEGNLRRIENLFREADELRHGKKI